MITVNKAAYKIRRNLTAKEFGDYEEISIEVSQPTEPVLGKDGNEIPLSDGTEMLTYCKELVKAFYSPTQAAIAPTVKQVSPQAPYQPAVPQQQVPSAAPRAYQPQGQGARTREPRAAQGQYVYSIPFKAMNDSWKAMCKQSGGGFDGFTKQWKSNILLPGAEAYLVGSAPQGNQQPQDDQDDLPFLGDV